MVLEIEEDGRDDGRIGEEREDPHLGAAGEGTGFRTRDVSERWAVQPTRVRCKATRDTLVAAPAYNNASAGSVRFAHFVEHGSLFASRVGTL
jgi:hypothetical protein